MLLRADARQLPLADASVHCVVTSPPYWGLRDYGSVNQIGLEPTPAAYVASIVSVFAELWRVCRDDATVWLNLGDTYCNSDKWGGGGVNTGKHTKTVNGEVPSWSAVRRRWSNVEGIKPKDLVGIPWRVAFALQAGGWYLRSDIIWSKPNPMPESVQDRPTKAHEYLFLLTKSERYFYDADAIAEQSVTEWMIDAPKRRQRVSATGGAITGGTGETISEGTTRNKRSVWTVNTEAYVSAHFATMPEALVEPCILAGCPLGGLVLDPFLGSGTVGAVAERLGRRWVGTDLAYHALAQERTSQRGFSFV